jgi:hypothetical protein
MVEVKEVIVVRDLSFHNCEQLMCLVRVRDSNSPLGKFPVFEKATEIGLLVLHPVLHLKQSSVW